jgi:hypothetical protein
MVLEPMVEHLRELVEKYAELEGAQRSVANAFKLYVKTRPSASAESSKRARQLQREGAPRSPPASALLPAAASQLAHWPVAAVQLAGPPTRQWTWAAAWTAPGGPWGS